MDVRFILATTISKEEDSHGEQFGTKCLFERGPISGRIMAQQLLEEEVKKESGCQRENIQHYFGIVHTQSVSSLIWRP